MVKTSLVTACMNREAHLRASLPAWLRLPGVDEIIIVDWSNERPLLDLTGLDRRVRVIRATGEPRWVLSYAYNLGVSRASGDTVLKCDADCLPHAEAALLTPGPAHFYAGFWKSGLPVGKPSVNGQCIFAKAQFEAVNGYSEFIRTYGRDDEDFYDRLIAAGFERREISPAGLDFLEHKHEARMANQIDPSDSGIEGWLRGDVMFNEMRNLFLARALPWGATRTRMTFASIEKTDRTELVHRIGAELPIPPAAAAFARISALRYVTQKATGLAAAAAGRLDEKSCLALLANRLARRTQAADACAA